MQIVTGTFGKSSYNGCQNFLFRWLQLIYKKRLRWSIENGIVDWDYSNSTVKVFDGIKKSWETITFNESDNEMYLKEISHVVKCINDKIPSTIIDLNNGINTFKISERIKHKSH